MFTRRVGKVVLTASAVLLLCCKRQAPAPPPPPVVAPAAPAAPYQPPPAEPQDDPKAYRPPPGGPMAGAWPPQKPDLPRPRDAGAKPTDAKQPRSPSDADIAAFKKAKAKQEAEKAVETTVTGAIPGVEACFRQHKVPPGERTLTITVHRSGRVLSSSISGVDGDADRCVGRILGDLHVNGALTETMTVKRQLRSR